MRFQKLGYKDNDTLSVPIDGFPFIIITRDNGI